MPIHRHIAVACAIGLSACGTARAETHPYLQLRVDGEWLEGQALVWSRSNILFLTRDGFLKQFSPAAAADYRQLAGRFSPYSAGEMRSRLQREFGKRFDVSGTGHYLVVHPAGQRDRWAPRFESLYRSFVHYFASRGRRPGAIQFPLVAVVFPTRAEFAAYARSTGSSLPRSVLGYYSPRSNRILLYDITAERSGGPWHQNASTIIHEATHQTAYNTGIHNRFAPPPKWVAEGLATMFEAPGVWNAGHHRDRSTRINRGRLADFQRYLSRRPRGSLAAFVQSDALFQQDALAAYAEAWALTFFLAESHPRQYREYLATTAARPPFTRYSAEQRLSDFQRAFGGNLSLLESHFLRFISGLK